jgi:hypothetical protein
MEAEPAAHPDCDWPRDPGPPFLFPTDGFAGFLWGDSFGLRHTHQGIDIFAGTDVGITPVIAAYPGYLTRLPEWKSAVIVRVPDDRGSLYPHGRPERNSFSHLSSPPALRKLYWKLAIRGIIPRQQSGGCIYISIVERWDVCFK